MGQSAVRGHQKRLVFAGEAPRLLSGTGRDRFKLREIGVVTKDLKDKGARCAGPGMLNPFGHGDYPWFWPQHIGGPSDSQKLLSVVLCVLSVL